MARYVDDYRGISGHEEMPRGMDPNYRGPYGGMRMGGHPGQAAYGRYRARHAGELGGMHGARGMYTGEFESSYDRPGHRGYEPGWHGAGYDAHLRGGYDAGMRRGYDAAMGIGYDRGWQGGGVHGYPDSRLVWGRGPGYDRELGGRTQRGRYDHSLFGHDRSFRPGYSDRGMSSGGYSEGWAWGPMRGSR